MKKLFYLLSILFITSTCSSDPVEVIDNTESNIELTYSVVPVFDTVTIVKTIPVKVYDTITTTKVIYDTNIISIYEYIPIAHPIYEYTNITVYDTILIEDHYCSKQGLICRLLCGKK